MRILIASVSRFEEPSGVCRASASLARALALAGESVALAVGAWQTEYFGRMLGPQREQVSLQPVAIANHRLARNAWFLWGLPRLAQDLSPDIIHLSYPVPLLRLRSSTPVVVTVHDLYPFDSPENFGRYQALLYRSAFRRCLKTVSAAVCVSQCTADRLQKELPELVVQKPVPVIHNYVDFNGVVPCEPPFACSIGDRPFWLTVGQHRKNKNLGLLLESFAGLVRGQQLAGPPRLLVVGARGPETARLTQQISSQRMQDEVRLISSVNDAELAWLYENCQLFLCPSLAEGFCLPLAEALWFGCRVVCSDIPILREVGSAECVYFSLAHAPVEALTAAALESLARARPRGGRRGQFGAVEAGRAHVDLYTRLLAGAR